MNAWRLVGSVSASCVFSSSPIRSFFQKVSFQVESGENWIPSIALAVGRMFQDTTFIGTFIHTAPQ